MIYAYVSRPELGSDWYVEEIQAYTLTEARGKYKLLRKKYPDHISRSLVGGPSLAAIEKAYSGKIY